MAGEEAIAQWGRLGWEPERSSNGGRREMGGCLGGVERPVVEERRNRADRARGRSKSRSMLGARGRSRREKALRRKRRIEGRGRESAWDREEEKKV